VEYRINTKRILTDKFNIKSKIETRAKEDVIYGTIDFRFDNSIVFPEFYNN
jgi:hypothetical protein